MRNDIAPVLLDAAALAAWAKKLAAAVTLAELAWLVDSASRPDLAGLWATTERGVVQ